MTGRQGAPRALLDGALALLGRFWLRRCRVVGEGTVALGRIWVRGEGTIRIGKRVVLDARHAPIELVVPYEGSEIVLGDDVVIEGGTSIEADRSIRIGDRTHIGRFCRLMDSHFHPLRGDRNQRPPAAPVVVENDVEMGERAILLAGSHVEHHVVVHPGTVITRRVRAHAAVRGVPAQVVVAGGATP